LRQKRVSHLSIRPCPFHDTHLLLSQLQFSADPRPQSRSKRVCLIHTAHMCLSSGVLFSPTPNFRPPPSGQEPIQERLGLLTIHSAKPSLPLPNSSGNFSNPFVSFVFDKVTPNNESRPFHISPQFPLPVSTALPHLLKSLELIRPQRRPQDISRFPTSTYYDRYRSDKARKQ